MDLGIKDKVALVLGGGGGLGGAIALALAREGVRVAVADIDLAAAQRSSDAIARAGGSALALQWDLTESSLIADRLDQVTSKLGEIDILINNSGGPKPARTDQLEDAQWRSYFDSMVVSLMAITRHVLPGMQRRGWGRVVTSTSSGVVAPIPHLAVSNTLRLALVGWSKSLAAEVASDGVTVNVTVPGRIATNRVAFLDQAKAQSLGKSVEQVSADSTASIPAGRYGDPGEYADVVTFLASARASYITGSLVRVDGGLLSSI